MKRMYRAAGHCAFDACVHRQEQDLGLQLQLGLEVLDLPTNAGGQNSESMQALVQFSCTSRRRMW